MRNSIKKSVLAALMASMMPMAWAQAWVGYCEDSDIMTSSVSSSNTNATVSVAAAFLPEMFEGMPQSVIRSIGVGLYQVSGIETLTVWTAEHLGSEPLAKIETDVTQLTEGWNNFALPEEIDPQQMPDTIYVGISYTQNKKSVKVMGSSGTKGTPNSFWAGSDGKWQDRSGSYKPACLRMGVFRTEGNDIRLADAWIEANRYQETDTEVCPIKVRGIVQNVGSDTLQTFAVRVTSVGEKSEAVACNEQLTCCLPYMQKGEFAVDVMPAIAQRNAELRIELLWTDETVDDNPTDNQQTLYYDVVEPSAGVIVVHDAGVLAEQFLSLGNGWSVLGQEHVDEAIGQYSVRQDAVPVVMLTHHRGYGPADSLTIADKGDYSARTIFGRDELSYAPALSIDRNKVMSSTEPSNELSVAISELVATKQPHTAIRTAEVTGDGTERLIKAVVEMTSYAWCANPVLMAALVRTSTAITSGSQKRYDVVQEEDWSETNVIVKYLTAAKGISLIDGSGNAAGSIRAIEEGRVPSPEPGVTEYSIMVSLPADAAQTGADETHPEYSVVLWVCNMTDDDRSVDSVKSITIDY